MTSLAYLTFVAIDRQGGRVRMPPLLLETEEERHEGARAGQGSGARRDSRPRRNGCLEARHEGSEGREASEEELNGFQKTSRPGSSTLPQLPSLASCRNSEKRPSRPGEAGLAAPSDRGPSRARDRARSRVGAMLSRRLTPLIVRQMPRAVRRLRRPRAPRTGGSRPRILEDRFAQRQESLDIPRFDVVLVGVDVDRKIEEVRDHDPAGARLQDVQAFDDDDVGPIDDLELAGNDVVRLMRVDRGVHGAVRRLDVAP